MMPKKPEKERRSYLIGVKVDTVTREKLKYLAGMKGDKVSTYIYNLLINHITEKEPWISNEIEQTRKDEEND